MRAKWLVILSVLAVAAVLVIVGVHAVVDEPCSSETAQWFAANTIVRDGSIVLEDVGRGTPFGYSASLIQSPLTLKLGHELVYETALCLVEMKLVFAEAGFARVRVFRECEGLPTRCAVSTWR